MWRGGGSWWNGSTAVNDNAWHHVAVTFDGNQFKMWIDGTLDATADWTSTYYTTPHSEVHLRIGADSNPTPGRKFTGWVDEIRITRGTARYTSGFTAPTNAFARPTDKLITTLTGLTGAGGAGSSGGGDSHTTTTVNTYSADWNYVAANSGASAGGEIASFTTKPFYTNTSEDEDYSKTVILNHFDDQGGGGDDSLLAASHTIDLQGNMVLSTDQAKFGTSSLYSDGDASNKFIYEAIPQFNLTDRNFTVELWMYPTDLNHTSYSTVFSTFQSGYAPIILYGRPDGTLLLYVSYGSGWDHTIHSAPVIVTDQWQHIAIVRNGTEIKVYHQGTAIITAEVGTNSLMDPSVVMLGNSDSDSSSPYAFAGYLDEFRFIVGKARYTSNFTPTESAFSGEANFIQDVVVDIDSAINTNQFASFTSKKLYTTFSTDDQFNNVKLLLHAEDVNGTTDLVDDSPNHHSVINHTPGDTAIVTSQSKYGTSSLRLSAVDLAAGDEHWDSVMFLVGFEGGDDTYGITDESSNAYTLNEEENFQITTDTAKFGTGALKPRSSISKSSRSLWPTDQASYYVRGSEQFTFEFWVYPTAHGGSHFLGDEYGGNRNFMQIGYSNGGGNSGSSHYGLAKSYVRWEMQGSTKPTLNQWNHIALTRDASNVMRIFINGVQTSYTTRSDYFYVGHPQILDSKVAGMDEIRYTRGVCRYDSNFTPPATKFPRGKSASGTVEAIEIKDDFNIDGDYTIEAFVRPTDVLTTLSQPIFYNGSTLKLDAIYGGQLQLRTLEGTITTTASALSSHEWSHVAVTREGNNTTLYANGISAAGMFDPVSGGTIGSNDSFRIGYENTSQNRFVGWMDEFRITDNVARYSGATYTEPASSFSGESRYDTTVVTGISAAVDVPGYASVYTIVNDNSANWNTAYTGVGSVARYDTTDLFTNISTDQYYYNIGALLHFEDGNGAITTTDDSANSHEIVFYGDAQISTAQSKYGSLSASLFLDGTNDYISLPNHDSLDLGSGDFTIEMWIRPGTVSHGRGIWGLDSGAGSNPKAFFRINGTSELQFSSHHIGGSNIDIVTSGANITADQWAHIAVVRSGTTAKIYVDGVEKGTGTLTDNITVAATTTIGYIGEGSSYFHGYIDEVRITPKTARYTSGFTPPTEQFSGESRFRQTVVTSITGTVTDTNANSTYESVSSLSANWNTESLGLSVSDEITNLSVGTTKLTFRMPYALTLTNIRANVNTAPTDAALIIDVNDDGSSILSSKLVIDASEKTSTTSASAAVISQAALADDTEITVDIDQVGSTTPGKGLKLWLLGYRT